MQSSTSVLTVAFDSFARPTWLQWHHPIYGADRRTLSVNSARDPWLKWTWTEVRTTKTHAFFYFRESLQQGWRMIAIMTAYYNPTDVLRPYLFKYLEQMAYDSQKRQHQCTSLDSILALLYMHWYWDLYVCEQKRSLISTLCSLHNQFSISIILTVFFLNLF